MLVPLAERYILSFVWFLALRPKKHTNTLEVACCHFIKRRNIFFYSRFWLLMLKLCTYAVVQNMEEFYDNQ